MSPSRCIRRRHAFFEKEGAANVWQCVVCGFAGLEWHEGGLSLRSHLPASWQRAAFNIVWRGAKLHVEVTHAGITVTHRGGTAVEITVDGHPVKLAAE